MASFIIIEHVKEDPSVTPKFWQGGFVRDFQAGIYRASNFRIEKNANDLVKRMRSYNTPRELRKDRDYSVLDFQEAKKLIKGS